MRARVVALVFVLFAVTPRVEASTDASTADDAARRSRVAVKVGGQTVTVGEIEDRIAAVHPLQLETLGTSRDAVVRAFVEQIVVRDLVLVEGALAKGLPKEPPTSHQLDRALSSATLRSLRAREPSAATLPEADVRKYYDENRSRFDAPERIHVARILCTSREDARMVLEAARKDASGTKWNELAREKSIDKATYLRGGNLGFLAADGTSSEAGLKVDAAIVRAASEVKDGELLREPVAEGSAFAVVWRRGSVPATHRSFEEASAQIRTLLVRQRIERTEKDLIEELRRAQVRDLNPALLGMIELPALDAGLNLPRSVPALPTARPVAPAPPSSPKR